MTNAQKYNICGKLLDSGYLIHGTMHDFTSFDSAFITGGFRAKEGYGFYFSDEAYKPLEYGQNINKFKIIKKNDFNFLELTDKVDINLFSCEDKYITLSRLEDELYTVRNNRDYEEINNEINQLKHYLDTNFNGDLFNEIKRILREKPECNYGQLQFYIPNPQKYIPIICQILARNGVDGFHYDNVYTVFNFDKLNKLMIKDIKPIINNIIGESVDKVIKETINNFIKKKLL